MTEKDYNPEQRTKDKGAIGKEKNTNVHTPAPKAEKKETPKVQENAEAKAPAKKTAPAKTVKKTEASVVGRNLPISTKYSVGICAHIKGMTIREAVDTLELAYAGKRAIPMKGELAHQKGKGMMSGRFPRKASTHFIKVLRSLGGNAVANGLDNPVIVEAYANEAARPFGRFGRTRKKRTHVVIRVKDIPAKIATKPKKMKA